MKLSTILIGTSVLALSLFGLKSMKAQGHDHAPDDSDADVQSACKLLPSFSQLKTALVAARCRIHRR